MKLENLAGVEIHKSWGGYFGAVGDKMTKFHDSAFSGDAITPPKQEPMTPLTSKDLPGFSFEAPSGKNIDPNKQLSDTMKTMRGNVAT